MDKLLGEFGPQNLLWGVIGFGWACLSAWVLFRRLWTSRASEYESKLTTLRSETDSAAELLRKTSEAKIEEMKGTVEAGTARCAALEARVRSMEESHRAELSKRATETESLRTELSNARLAAVNEDARIFAGLNGQVSELRAAKLDLERQLEESREANSKAQEQLTKEQVKIRDLEGTVATLRDESANAAAQKQAAEVQAREIEKEFRKVLAMREEEFVAMQSQTVAAIEAQKRFEGEVGAVRSEVALRDTEIGRLASEMNAVQAAGHERIQQLERDLAEAKANLSDQIEWTREKANLQAQLLERQAQLSERNEAVAKLEADAALLSHLRHSMRERQTQIDGLKLQLDQAKLEASELRAQLSDRNETVAKLEADAALLSHVRHSMRERQTQIDGRKLQLEQSVQHAPFTDRQEAVAKLVAAPTERQTETARFDVSKVETTELSERLAKQEVNPKDRQTELDGLKLQLAYSQQEVADLRMQLAERNELIAKLEADAGLLSHVRHSMRERQTQIDGLKLQLEHAKQEASDLQAQLSDRNEAVAKLEADAGLLSHVRHSMRERQTQIDGLKLQLEHAKQEAADLQAQLSDRNEAVAKLEADAGLLSHVRHSMRERQTQIDGLMLQLEQAQQSAAASERQIQLLESNLMQASLANQESEVAALRAEVAVRDARIQTLEAELAEAVSNLQGDASHRAEPAATGYGYAQPWQATPSTPNVLSDMPPTGGLGSQATPPMLAFGAAVGGGSKSGAIPAAVLETAAVPQPQTQSMPRDYAELQAGLRLASLRGIQFLPDSDTILPESIPTLDEALQTIRQLDAECRVEIGGHTDSWGDPAQNRELSLRRAKAVRKYLVGNGTSPAMLIATGYGDTRPIADNESADGRFANRRIEFLVRGSIDSTKTFAGGPVG